MNLKCEIAANTDVGRQRFRNEDNFVVLEEYSLAIVADGMGGHVDGDVASKIVVQTLRDRYENLYEDEVKKLSENSEDDHLNGQRKFLIESIQNANFKIFEKNQGIFSLDSMGTTVVGLQITSDGHFISACVGDSRIYRVRGGEIQQITEDHSLVGELIRYKIIQEKDLLFLQNKNIITRALGMAQNVEVDTKVEKAENGDLFLLCSDGLTDLISNDEILQVLLENENLDECVQKLVEAANSAGGLDNITVALVRISE